MADNTTMEPEILKSRSVVLIALAIIGMAVPCAIAFFHYQMRAVQWASIAIILFSLAVFAGYLSGHPVIYTWSKISVGVALPTAACLLVIGMCLFTLARAIIHKEHHHL